MVQCCFFISPSGILITAKNRQEFRIRLQKRARRKAEKRVDNLEEDRHNKTVRVQENQTIYLPLLNFKHYDRKR